MAFLSLQSGREWSPVFCFLLFVYLFVCFLAFQKVYLVLNFGLGRDVRREDSNMGACTERIKWGLVDLIFLTNCSLSELILAQMN